MSTTLQYVAFSSAVNVSFWHELSKHKLEEYKLDDTAKDIIGSFVNNDRDGLTCRLNIEFSAFNSKSDYHVPHSFYCPGLLINKNTVEDFKACDKKALLKDVAKQIIEDIKSGVAFENTSLLNRFLVLTFADLKRYDFYYWFAFPALNIKEHINIVSINPITAIYNETEIYSLEKAYDSLRDRVGHDPFAFILKKVGTEFESGLLSDWDQFYDGPVNVVLGFSDPSTMSENPGWPLRNLLTCISYQKKSSINHLSVICYRDRFNNGKREIKHSLFLEIDNLPEIELEENNVVGWEKNQRGKMGPRMVNLSATMDPLKLAESAVDLNLKLMRWRLVPDLDLDKIKSTKCLLLGSGTLGCNVARSLLGWGIQKITFVDNSRVSFSNPVRQTLFQFEDCLNGGKVKAQAAAESLKRIFPGVDATGVYLNIPMPGHAISVKDERSIQNDVATLEELISQHDAVFLLMDSRESRWLPSVIAASKRKILINAALGFDTFLVMRHGNQQLVLENFEEINSKTVRIPGHQLGCYFCNDVVAPGNSTIDRTLDQQCTVSRPGVSMMASASAVELLISLLQHPLGNLAPAETSANENHLEAEFETPIGIIPHQIRCFLSRFHIVLPACRAFDKCTCCSPLVLKAYEEDGFSFLHKVFNLPTFLEDLTGLTEFRNAINDSEIEQLVDTDDENNLVEN
ncbi:ubiquitin-like modifier-activating enzyme ATG7 isoform X1 [Hydra vulgaris]|nr:ubiquitin-like modifier-activating enzyme ATG7 isoform X1 [Hydra vulgaris]